MKTLTNVDAFFSEYVIGIEQCAYIIIQIIKMSIVDLLRHNTLKLSVNLYLGLTLSINWMSQCYPHYINYSYNVLTQTPGNLISILEDVLV